MAISQQESVPKVVLFNLESMVQDISTGKIQNRQQYVHCVKPAAGRLGDLGRNHKAVLIKKSKCSQVCV